VDIVGIVTIFIYGAASQRSERLRMMQLPVGQQIE
jgi:hypothetical protein